MVEYQPGLDRTFAALSDPTRRALLARLNEGSRSVTELARPFPISLQAVIKHLDVLSDAGLIERKKSGRTVACTLRPEPMARAAEWLERYRREWNERFDRLETYLQRIQQGETDGT